MAFGRFFLQRCQGIAHQLVDAVHLRRHLGLSSTRGLVEQRRLALPSEAAVGKPRAARSSSAHTGTGGRVQQHPLRQRPRDGEAGTPPTLPAAGCRGHRQRREPGYARWPASPVSSWACSCQRATSARGSSSAACASRQGVVEHFDALCQQQPPRAAPGPGAAGLRWPSRGRPAAHARAGQRLARPA